MLYKDDQNIACTEILHVLRKRQGLNMNYKESIRKKTIKKIPIFDFSLLTIFTKSFIIGNEQNSKYTSVFFNSLGVSPNRCSASEM